MEFLTINETCRALGGISRWTVARLIDAGAFTAAKESGHNGAVRVHSTSLARFVDRHTFPTQECRMSTTVPALHPLTYVAEKTGLSLIVLQRALRAGRFEHVHFGRTRYMTDAQIEAMVKQLTKDPDRPADPSAATRARVARMQERQQSAPRQRRGSAA